MSSFITGFKENSILIGTGEHTDGIILQVKQAHSPGIPTLCGAFRILANHKVAHNLLSKHLPEFDMTDSENSFEMLRTTILNHVGIEHNAEMVNKQLFHPKQWKAVEKF